MSSVGPVHRSSRAMSVASGSAAYIATSRRTERAAVRTRGRSGLGRVWSEIVARPGFARVRVRTSDETGPLHVVGVVGGCPGGWGADAAGRRANRLAWDLRRDSLGVSGGVDVAQRRQVLTRSPASVRRAPLDPAGVAGRTSARRPAGRALDGAVRAGRAPRSRRRVPGRTTASQRRRRADAGGRAQGTGPRGSGVSCGVSMPTSSAGPGRHVGEGGGQAHVERSRCLRHDRRSRTAASGPAAPSRTSTRRSAGAAATAASVSASAASASEAACSAVNGGDSRVLTRPGTGFLRDHQDGGRAHVNASPPPR